MRKTNIIPYKESDFRETNADRIRQMKDEEIADMLNIYDTGEICQYCVNRGSMCIGGSCYHGILEWLKQEAKDDDERR